MALTALIPKMTSATTPSGVASASSEYGAGYAAWRCMDQTFNLWISADGTHPQWVRYQFASAKAVAHYTLVTHSNSAWVATAWTFEGSNDAVAWTVLDTQTAQGTAMYKLYTITPASVGSYLYYQLNISAGSAVFDAIYALQMYSGGTDVADYPPVADVRLAVTFDTGAKVGTCRVPAVGKVESGYAYDAADSLTGTMMAVNPSVTIPAPTPVQLAGTETTIYLCPADTIATVKVLRLANCHTSAVTATIYKVVSGDTAADDTTQTKTRSLGAAGTATADDEMGPFTLTAGDKISGLASVASKITCTAEVYEVAT